MTAELLAITWRCAGDIISDSDSDDMDDNNLTDAADDDEADDDDMTGVTGPEGG
jgi:hypothetical protein